MVFQRKGLPIRGRWVSERQCGKFRSFSKYSAQPDATLVLVHDQHSRAAGPVDFDSPRVAEPITERSLIMGNLRVIWWNQIREGIRNRVAFREGPRDG